MRIEDANPFIVRDYNKCILCRRCVRACDEINGVEAIGLIERGFDTKIGTAFDGSLQRLALRVLRHVRRALPDRRPDAQSGAWARGAPGRRTKTTTICPYCGVGCPLELNVKDNKIVKVTSDWDGAANQGWTVRQGALWLGLCRARRAPDHAPDHARTAQLVEATWDEALDLVADQIRRPSPRSTAPTRWPSSARPSAPTKRTIWCKR